MHSPAAASLSRLELISDPLERRVWMLRSNAEDIPRLLLNAARHVLKLDMMAIVRNVANPFPLFWAVEDPLISRTFFKGLRNDDAIQMGPSNTAVSFQTAMTTRTCATNDRPILSIIEAKGISARSLSSRPALEGRRSDTTQVQDPVLSSSQIFRLSMADGVVPISFFDVRRFSTSATLC
jgi:hypothetical protein